MHEVILYSSLATSTLKVKKDIQSLKFLLQAKKIEFTEYDVGSDPDKLKEMQEKSGKKTIPQFFVDGKYIGGWDEVEELNDYEEFDILFA